MARHQEWKCSPLRSKAKNGIHKSARAARANNACQTSAHASPIRTRDTMATPMSSPNILWQLEVRRFEYTFRWADGKFTGEAMLVLNNNRVLSQLPKTSYHHKILERLERTEFKGFAINHSEWQRRLFKSRGGEPGFLFIRFFPVRIRITAEPEIVVWKDDSPGGSAIDAIKTPNPFDQSSEEPSASIIHSVGSPGKHGGFRPQVTQPDQFAPSQSKVVPMPAGDAPHDGDKVESPSRKLLQNRSRYLRWDGKENSRLHTNQAPTTTEFRYAPEEVVRNDDSPDGSTTDPTNLRETPDSYINLSSESPPTSVPRSVAPSEEEVKFRSRAGQPAPGLPLHLKVLAASTIDDPHYAEVKSIRGKAWTDSEVNVATDIVKGNRSFRLIDFPGRTIGGIQKKLFLIRKSLVRDELPSDPVHLIGFSRYVAVAVAARLRDGKSVNEVIEALPNASEQEIWDEYFHLKQPESANWRENMRAFLQSQATARWQVMRGNFPGIPYTTVESVREGMSGAGQLCKITF